MALIAFRWQIVKQSQDSVLFSLVSEDGDQGFQYTECYIALYALTDSNEVTFILLLTVK